MNQYHNILGTAKIVSNKEEKEYKNKYIIKYKKYKFILYVEKDFNFQYGDIVYIDGEIEEFSFSKNFKLFDYKRYLRQNKIYGILNVNNIQKIGQEKDLFFYLENLKQKLKRNLFSVFDKEKAGFLLGLLIGDKSEIFDETKTSFKNSSLSHILALSGLHIVYVTSGIKFILDFFIKNQRLKNFLMIAFLIFFSIFTGGSPSCIRACIMSSMLFLSKIVFRKNDFITSLLISLDIILIINCYNIESTGMWLSFLATFGIVYIKFNSSIACNLMILPIIWNSYNRISLTFFISNFFASYLIGPIIILGYIYLLLGEYSKCFSFFEKFLIDMLFKISKKIGNFSLSKILVPSINIIFWIIYYVIIFVWIYFYYHKDIFYVLKNKLIFILRNKLNFMQNKKCIIIVLFFMYMMIFTITKGQNFELHFIDVGQGDCSLILTPSNKTILIDGGNNEGFDNGENVIVPYLLKNRITKLDYVIVSHRRFRPYWRFILCFRKYECKKRCY